MVDPALGRRQVLWKVVALSLGLATTAVLILLGVLEDRSEWASYQRRYAELAGTPEPGGPPPASDVRPEVLQINLPDLQRVDRCTSCHLGVVDPRMSQAPLPLTQHSSLLTSHPPTAYGCEICHGGEGRAVTVAEGHGETPGQHSRLLPSGLRPSRCYLCHGLEGLPPQETAIVAEGVKLFNLYRCLRCHQIDGAGGSIGPDLSVIASQRNWIQIYAHLLKPDALVPGSTMPAFGLSREEATGLTAFLLTLLDRRDAVRDPSYLASETTPESMPSPGPTPDGSLPWLARSYQGKQLFEGLECLVCHRVGLRGGSVGPTLTHIGLSRDREWLRDMLIDPRAVFPNGQMPEYDLSEAQVNALADYMLDLR